MQRYLLVRQRSWYAFWWGRWHRKPRPFHHRCSGLQKHLRACVTGIQTLGGEPLAKWSKFAFYIRHRTESISDGVENGSIFAPIIIVKLFPVKAGKNRACVSSIAHMQRNDVHLRPSSLQQCSHQHLLQDVDAIEIDLKWPEFQQQNCYTLLAHDFSSSTSRPPFRRTWAVDTSTFEFFVYISYQNFGFLNTCNTWTEKYKRKSRLRKLFNAVGDRNGLIKPV